jgi:hypothetical protein
VEIYDNETSPCGGGVSVEHRNYNRNAVLFKDCIFRNNRCQVTSSALDILPGSSAAVINCLFVDNIANKGIDYVGRKTGNEYNKENGSGALTVFAGSRVLVERCTFTGNWNGVDDKSKGSRYTSCIFWKNNRTGGISPGGRYEMDILDGTGVANCFLNGDTEDLRGKLDATRNTMPAPDPLFDERYVPKSLAYDGIGYRPVP